jgi:ubiquinone/menaquinone biosynthesis C-methylase UbiE
VGGILRRMFAVGHDVSDRNNAMSWKEAVKKRFSVSTDANKWDQMYERDTEKLDEHFFRLRRDFTVDFIVNNYDKRAKLCDLGCGAGPVTFELLRKGYDITGLDYSLDMLNNAARRIGSGQIYGKPLINGNCEALPLGNDVFDCVACLGVISYVEHYENIIKEIFRVLKPGGIVLVTFRNKYNLLMNDPIVLARFLAKKILFRPEEKQEFEIGQYLCSREVQAVIESNGFDFLDFKGIGFGPFNLRYRQLFSDKTSIKISQFISGLADKLHAEFVYRLASDVNILLFRKP